MKNKHGGARKGAGIKLGTKKSVPKYNEFQDHTIFGLRITKTEFNEITKSINKSGKTKSGWLKQTILKEIRKT